MPSGNWKPPVHHKLVLNEKARPRRATGLSCPELLFITPPAVRRPSREYSMTGCVQSTAESPERDVQSADGIFPILAYGAPEFAQPYSAANRGRTNKRHPTCERPDRCHVASPNRS